MLEESSAAIPIVSPKTFYITSQIPASGHRFFQRPIASYLEIHFGENDGVVALEDQSLAGIGKVLAVLDAGHTDLTNRFPSGHAAQRMRKAIVDAIIMSVGEERAARSRERKDSPETRSGAERTVGRGRSAWTFQYWSALIDLGAGTGRQRLVDSHRRPGREQAGRGIVRDVGRCAVGRIVRPGVDRFLDEADRSVQEGEVTAAGMIARGGDREVVFLGVVSCRNSRCLDRRRCGRTGSWDRAS